MTYIVAKLTYDKWGNIRLDERSTEAIPIEWIEKQIKMTTDITNEKELDVLYAGNLSYMLKLWEKENEAD